MAFTFGFYNSLNGDRRYDAVQMSKIFDGLIKDGVFATVGDALVTTESTGMTVNVGTGRAWFNHTWSLNDAPFPITLDPAEILQDRYDTIVLDINSEQATRANSIKLIKGQPSTTPSIPAVIRSPLHNQYRLCDIFVGRGVTKITQSVIALRVGVTDTPFVTGIIQTINTNSLIQQWSDQWNTWFAGIKDIISKDEVANLTIEVGKIKDRVTALEQGSPSPSVGISPEMHRTTFRGKNLGTTVTSAQQQAIQNGTFDDLFVGDYWNIGGIIWRIVDINYWFNKGDTAFVTNHLVIMPDNPLYTATMNSTGTTASGYAGSLMYTTNLNQAKTAITNAFGALVKSHRQFFTNTVVTGRPTAGNWYASTVDLPNRLNMYGDDIMPFGNTGDGQLYTQTIDFQQFSAFAIKPSLILGTTRSNQWLRDVVSDTAFAFVSLLGMASNFGLPANTVAGVRPCFAIG